MQLTHVLVDTWMLTVKSVYKLLNVSDDLKCTTNTRDTIYTHFEGITDNIYGFGRPFLLLVLPGHPYFYPPTTVFTHHLGGRVSVKKPVKVFPLYQQEV